MEEVRPAFRATHAAVFSFAAVLVVAFSAGTDVPGSCLDCLPFQFAYASSHTVTVTHPTNTANVNAILTNLEPGGTVVFSSGTYPWVGVLDPITKPVTITGEPGAVLTGYFSMAIRSSDVTVKNLTFNEITRGPNTAAVIDVDWWGDPNDLSNITISNNTITNTGGNGITILDDAQSTITDLRITDNVFKNIGTHLPGATPAEVASRLATGIRTAENGLLKNLYISGNTIENTSFAGINLGASAIINGHINDNTISDMLAFGIQKAVERTHGGGVGKLAGPDASLLIYDNTISDTNNALEYLDGTAETVPEAAVVIWGADDSNVRVFDNVIRDSHNGVLLCAGAVCGVHQDNLGEQLDIFRVVDAPINQFISVVRNSFIGNTGFDLVNLSRAPVFAPFNYWDRTPAERISGNASYSPYYTDEARTATAEISERQAAISLSQSGCSVSLGGTVTFNLVTGGESPAVKQTVTNAGTSPVESMRLRVDSWTDSADNPYSTLTTFVKVGGEFVELPPDQLVAVGSALASPGSSELEFKVVHSGRVLPTGDGALSQAMTLFASCG